MPVASQEIKVHLPTPHAKQAEFEQNARRFNIICAGRRFGKDIELQRRLVRTALHTKQPVAFYAPTYRMLVENWRSLKTILAPVTTRQSEAEHRIELITGNAVEMWSLDNPDSSRGRKYAHVCINEAAMVKELEYAWTMVIRPTLADYKGGADFGSTPKGLNGFFVLWQRAGDDPEWARFHYRTEDNPHIPPEEITAMRNTLPGRVVKQELDAEFLEDGSYFQGVDTAATIQRPDEPKQHEGHYCVMGVDWALSEDFTVLTVGCRDCNRVVDWQRFNQIDYTFQRERVKAMARRWKAQVLPERNSIGLPNLEILGNEGIPILPGADGLPGFNTSATTKAGLIQGLAGGIEHEKFLVPAEYADELKAYQGEYTGSGNMKFGAPSGIHDDRVISLALCWLAMTNSGVRIVEDPFAGW